MKILITGGCGFIGSNYIHFLLKRYDDIEIINVDKLTYAGNKANLADIETDRRYRFVKADIINSSIISNFFNDIELVVNFAAETHVDRSINCGDTFIQTNIQGTYTLLELCRKFDCRFIQISTDEVYGNCQKGYFTEDATLKPSSVYSASKASADILVNAYKTTYGLHTNITRSSNNFGPYQYPEKLVPRFITNLLMGKKVTLYGNGKNIRDWIFVEDNCSAIDTIIRKGKNGEIYNIGGGNEKTNIEITHLILKKLGMSKNMITFVRDRPGHDFRYAVDSSKIKALGWKPQYKFDEAFDITVNWYIKNKNWWKPLIS